MPTPEQSERAAAWQREQDAKATANRIRKAGIPPRYLSADIGQCDSRVIAYADGIRDGGTGWLHLKGPNGRGKTMAAAAALMVIAEKRRVEFASMQGILNSCKATYGTHDSESDIKDHFKNVDVLLIDDFGKEKPTDWSLPIIFEIFEARHSKMRPTIITTNLDGKGLIAHMAKHDSAVTAKSVISRIVENTKGRIIEFGGPDRRFE